MSTARSWLDRHLYPGFADNWDDDMFRKVIDRRIHPGCRLLDYGAGRGNVKQMKFRGVVKFVAGIDPDEAVLGNPYLDEAKLLDAQNPLIPYPPNSFDVVVSDNVMEHLPEPQLVFDEILRVLKPGGAFLAKTPNRWHYMPVIARMTPSSFHAFYNSIRGRESSDTFPTYYNCNDVAAIESYARQSGFEVRAIDLIEGRPEYLRLFPPTYLLGYLYERLVNSTDAFSRLRSLIIFELTKRVMAAGRPL